MRSELSSLRASSETEVARLQQEVEGLRLELSSTQSALASERDKLRSLEASLANIASSDSSRIAAERRAAEERAAELQERERTHAEELAAVQEWMSSVISGLKMRLASSRDEWERTNNELRAEYDQYRRGKEAEVEQLSRCASLVYQSVGLRCLYLQFIHILIVLLYP